jgi:type II secretory pathway predicted ATPase ExeA/cell division septation protein DedD
MHEEYYGFSDKPFSLTPDPKYLYKSESHANAFDLLQYAIRRREGFVVVTGDIGTGKTTLCRAILEQLDRKTFTALVLNPFLSEEDLLRLILQDFGVVSREEMKRGRLAGVTKQELIDTLNEFLLSLLPLGAGALLIIDEAQNLPRQVLEQIRVLSNLETHKEKLLQIVLVGQLNLKDLLRSPDLRQLDQRVSIRYELKPLTGEETAAYVAHRLTIAGGGAVVSFAPKALDLVHKYTGGIPRLINLVCDRALLGGYSARTNRITPEMVDAAAARLDLVRSRGLISGWVKRNGVAFAAGAAMTALLSIGIAYVVTSSQPGSEVAKTVATPSLDSQLLARDRPATESATAGMKGTSGPAMPKAVDSQPATSAPHTIQPGPGSPAHSYSILVGSFRYEPEAAVLISELSDLGYHARIARVSSSTRGIWHQVFVGPYSELELAKQDQLRVRQLPGYGDAQLVTQ